MKFSLLIPSYNRPELIREAVDSCIANQAPDVEIIVSDDASPRRAEIRGALADLIEKGVVKYLQQEKNLRWSENRNALVREARGEYVILLGDDDRLKKGAIERLRYWTQRRPEVAMIGFGYDRIHEAGWKVFTYCTPRENLYELKNMELFSELLLFDATPMWSHHPFTMCTKRSVALSIPYIPRVDIADDVLYLYDVILASHQFLTIPEVLFEWRSVYEEQSNFASLSSGLARSYRSRSLVLAEVLSRPNLQPEVRALLTSTEFLRKCWNLRKEDARELGALMAQVPINPTAVADLTVAKTRGGSVPLPLTFDRLGRRLRTFGNSHLFTFLHERSWRVWLMLLKKLHIHYGRPRTEPGPIEILA